jgi:hypothetical protein
VGFVRVGGVLLVSDFLSDGGVQVHENLQKLLARATQSQIESRDSDSDSHFPLSDGLHDFLVRHNDSDCHSFRLLSPVCSFLSLHLSLEFGERDSHRHPGEPSGCL